MAPCCRKTKQRQCFLTRVRSGPPSPSAQGRWQFCRCLRGSLHGEAAVWLDIDATHTVDVVIFRCEVLQNVVVAKRLKGKGSGGAAIEATAQCMGAWTSRDSSTELAATLVAGGGVCHSELLPCSRLSQKSLPFSLCRCSSSSCGQMCWEKPTSARAKRLFVLEHLSRLFVILETIFPLGQCTLPSFPFQNHQDLFVAKFTHSHWSCLVSNLELGF